MADDVRTGVRPGIRSRGPRALSTRRAVLGGLATAGLAGALLTAGLLPSGASDKATLYLVQGLPGDKISFTVNGKTLASDVAGAQVVGPFSVSAGKVTFGFGWDGKQQLTRTMEVKAGSNSDVVLHLPAQGSGETVTTFRNDLAAVPQGKANLTVAHVAAVPAADIQVDGKVLFANVANGESLNLTVPAETYSVKIVPTGKDSPVILGPLKLSVKAGSLNRVYAFGRPSDKTMNVAVHTIAVRNSGSSAPNRVPTGSGGLALDSRPAPIGELLR
ncbi:hypothetical protein FHX74_003294 [Friedmanniella endophytica]|uniref:DUF4397 domain-containing protein n=1 Tax=Microlunatus kandeliicorticis TaxID=1759536 RepID=A0A7W3P752_9ACTN|nr:DUF4397 domain-containing protein [Microlunatus kandeliicorticis]MBA8795658.1 hypothetical protein [Microlunatus kandeliicorticis]